MQIMAPIQAITAITQTGIIAMTVAIANVSSVSLIASIAVGTGAIIVVVRMAQPD